MDGVEIRGDKNARDAIVFVHGFGVTRYDGDNLFKDIADGLSDYRSFLFDLNDKDADGLRINSLEEQVRRVNTVMAQLGEGGTVTVIAHSLGALIASMSPAVLARAGQVILLTPAIGDVFSSLHARFNERMEGQDETEPVTVTSKTVGELTFAAGFWPQLNAASPVTERIVALTKQRPATVISAQRDEVLPADMSDIFGDELCRSVDDDHNFTRNRATLISIVKETVQ